MVLISDLVRGNCHNRLFHGANLRFGPWELSKRVFQWTYPLIWSLEIGEMNISMEQFPDQDHGIWQNEDFHGPIRRFDPWKLAKWIFPWCWSPIKTMGIGKMKISMVLFLGLGRGNWQDEDFHGTITWLRPWEVAKWRFPWNDYLIKTVGSGEMKISMERFPD